MFEETGLVTGDKVVQHAPPPLTTGHHPRRHPLHEQIPRGTLGDTAEPALDYRRVPLIPVGEPQCNGSARSAALFVESTPSARRNVQRCSSLSSSSRHVAVDWTQVHSAPRRRS